MKDRYMTDNLVFFQKHLSKGFYPIFMLGDEDYFFILEYDKKYNGLEVYSFNRKCEEYIVNDKLEKRTIGTCHYNGTLNLDSDTLVDDWFRKFSLIDWKTVIFPETIQWEKPVQEEIRYSEYGADESAMKYFWEFNRYYNLNIILDI